MAEVQQKDSGGKKGKQKKNEYPGRLYPDGRYEHAFDYILYALYVIE